MLGLLISPPPEFGEGLQGYLGRVSAQNALSCHELRRHYRKSPPPPEEVQGWPECWTGIHQQLIEPAAKPMTIWNTRTRRYCPVCLKADGIWRAAWELSLVTSCVLHKLQLRQECPACGAQLTWQCNDLASCEVCGALITDIEPSVDDPKRVWLSDLLGQGLIEHKSPNASPLTTLCLSDLHQLSLILGARQSEASQVKPLKVKNSDALETCQRVALAAASLLIDWPFNFRRHIRERLGESELNGWRLPRRLGPIYSDVYKRLSQSSYDFVRSELELVVKSHWHGPINARNRRLSTEAKSDHEWRPISELSHRHAIPIALIRRLVNAGELLTEKMPLPSGRTQTLIYEDSLMRRIDQLRTIINLEQLAQLLSLPEIRVRQLAEVRYFECVGGRPKPGEKWWFTAKNIEGFKRIGTTLPVYENALQGQSSFADILRYLIQPEEHAQTLITKIRNGDLPAIGRLGAPEQIGEWLFSDDATHKLRNELLPKQYLNVQQSAKLLRLKDQVAYQLVHLGLLEADLVHVNEGPVFQIRPDAIDAFKKRYFLGSEIAKELGCAPRWLPPKLRAEGFEPIAGPGVVGAECRQYIWLRIVDLENFISVASRTNGSEVKNECAE